LSSSLQGNTHGPVALLQQFTALIKNLNKKIQNFATHQQKQFSKSTKTKTTKFTKTETTTTTTKRTFESI